VLSQDRYNYQHDLVPWSFVDSCIDLSFIRVYVDLPNFWASESPSPTILPNVIVTPFRPDIIPVYYYLN